MLLLGAEAAAKLIRRFGGTRLYITKLDVPARARRNDEIIRSYEAGRPGGVAGAGIRLERAPYLGDPQNARLMARASGKNKKP